jgi:hypothetical protein
MPTKIKAGVYVRCPDHPGRTSVQQQILQCRVAEQSLGWVVVATVSDHKKQLPTP